MMISVVMPTYRRAERLKEAVRNLFKTAPDVELIVVIEQDDAESRQAIDRLGAEGYLLRYSVSTQGNAVKAFNLGASVANGEAIMLGEDDVRFHTGWYENAKTLLHQGYGFIGCDNGNEHVCPTNYIATKEWLRKNARGVLSLPIFNQIGDVAMWHLAQISGDGVWARGVDNPLRVYVENMHPYVGKGKWDATYEKRRVEGEGDRAKYALWLDDQCPMDWEPVI